MSEHTNPYVPYMATLSEVKVLAPGINLFRCEFNDPADEEKYQYKPGQFGFLSAFGVGEAPFGLACSKERSNGYVEFAVQKLGTVTAALHQLEVGDQVGVRGPMGNWFPLDEIKGRRIVIIGGGIGMAPLRPVIQHVNDNSGDYAGLELLVAARAPNLLTFRDDYDEWASAPGTKFHVTVDEGDEEWTGNVGLITQLLSKVAPSPENAVAITCGPPIMIKFVLIELDKLGFKPEQVITTLESKMKCGLGKCGRCNVGDKYICRDGPVFYQHEIKQFIETF